MAVQVLEDEVDKRARQLRDEAVQRRRNGDEARDVTSVTLPKSVHGKWVNKDPKRVQHFRNNGYEVAKAVTGKDKDGKPIKSGIETAAGQISTTGEFTNGDNILMVTPRENQIDRLAKAKNRGRLAEESTKGHAEEMRKIARDAGAKAVVTDFSKQTEERVARRGSPMPDDDDD